MITLIKIICALLIFGLIILVHEFGHFIAARACGVKVIEFSLGMGPRLFTVHGRKTDYSLKLLPIGGSCNMKGETDDEDVPDSDSFNGKKAWQRFLIIFAGPCFNFILSFIVALILVFNLGTDLPVIAETLPGMAAEEAGLQAGDRITKINSRHVNLYREVRAYNMLNEGKYQIVAADRNGEEILCYLSPTYSDEYGMYMMGIVGSGENTFPDNILDTIRYSFYELRYNVLIVFDSIGYLFNGHLSADNVMGPVGIISNISETVEQTIPYGLKILLLTVAEYILLFGTNVGVLNLIPFPALDGGRLFLILIEMIIRRPINKKYENFINFAGFAALMLIMLIISLNDIGRLL